MVKYIALVLGIVIITLASCHPARADQYVIGNLSARHWDRSHNFNEHNYGLGLEETFLGDLAGHVGLYRNSLNKDSVYALVSYTPVHFKAVSAGIIGGAVTGYPIYPVVPVAGLLVDVK